MTALGPPPDGVDAVAMMNERSESMHDMIQQLCEASAPLCLTNGAHVRWLGPKVLPTTDFERGRIQYLVSVEFVILDGMAALPDFHAAAADFAESKVTEGASIFGADTDLVRTIRSFEDQSSCMPSSTMDDRMSADRNARWNAWPWRHNGLYNPSPMIATNSLAITAALGEALPAKCSLIEPAFMCFHRETRPTGVVMVSALLQCPADAEPTRQIAPAFFAAAQTCTGECGLANAAYANVFTHAITRRCSDASGLHSILRCCRKGANMVFGGLSELVNIRFGSDDDEDEDHDEDDDAE